MKKALLRCVISPGQFTGEYAVKGELHDGQGFSSFVNEEDLDCKRFPTSGEKADGWLHVEILEEAGNLALVSLPQQTLENGSTITVKFSQIQKRMSPQRA